MKTCILLSGGVDSIALTYAIRPGLALTIDYGQAAARAEIASSREVCRVLGINHKIVNINCNSIGTGEMVGRNDVGQLSVATSSEWWPFRNQLLITIGGAVCVLNGADELVIGTVASDRTHCDGRPRFVKIMSELLSMQEGGVRVSAPALEMQSIDLIKWSNVPPTILGWAHSCHRGNLCCTDCRGCRKLLALWDEIGFRDASVCDHIEPAPMD